MKSYRINTLILLFVLFCLQVFAQTGYYSDPIKIPIFLSGNFCELRPNHFHGGIDLKIQQKSGLPIHSVAEGFVSRIAVSPSGYGKVLYVEHPNGTTSVYAHLDGFSERIDKFIRDEQYSRKSFAVDIKPGKEDLIVEKDELIAFGGNSGSSEAPHLHFEIRDTPTQDALNPLAFNFNVTDHTPPKFFSLYAYPLTENSHVNASTSRKNFGISASGKDYILAQNAEIQAYGKIGFAIRANDFYDGSYNVCGVYAAQLTVNGEEIFAWSFDRMPFGDTRYMNSHIDYELSVTSGSRIHRLWRQPGNRLKIYNTDINRGELEVEDGKIYQVEINIRDIAGNATKLSFRVKGVQRNVSRTPPQHTRFFTYDEENLFRTPFFELFAPVGAFYDDLYFHYHVTPRRPGDFSKAHRLASETIPIHLPVKIRLLAEELPQESIKKSFIGRIHGNNGKSYAGGKYTEGWFETEIRAFGTYAIMTDTLPPVINPLSIRERNTLTESGRIRFTIGDNLAGIKSYEGTIDGNWVLFEYDAKYRLLTYEFDPERLELGKRHNLVLTVTDNVDNISTYEATFWK
jgi:hypothetical protein